MTTTLEPGLATGDRVPDFERSDQNDELFHLYRDCCGRSVALAVIPDDEALARRTLSDLRYASGLPGQPVRLALAPEHVDIQALARRLSLDFPLLSDDGEVSRYLAGQPLTSPSVFALDPNLRLLARFRPDPGWVANLRQKLAGAAPAATRDVVTSAPLLFVPRVLPRSLCSEIIAYFDEGGSETSEASEPAAEQNAPVRREKPIADSPLLAEVERLVARRVLPEIHRAFQFRVSRYEAFRVVRYAASEGGQFVAHRDGDAADGDSRRFAMTLNLNAERHRGGDLRFPEYGTDRYQPPTGGAVVFSCQLAHAVTPVTAGNRYALLTYFCGPKAGER